MAEYYSIGKGEIRQDALLKVTGKAEYSTDIHPKGMVYGKILGSPIPHGIIKSIDTSEAEKLPGVVCVVTGEDGSDRPTIGGYLTDRYIMNRVGQKVRFIGDMVAAVAAVDEQTAEAACKLIKVEYEPLPYVLDPEEAYKEDCPAIVHDDVQSYKRLDLHGVAHSMDKKHPNQAIQRKVRHSEKFDLDPDSFATSEEFDAAFEEKFNEEFEKAYLKLPTQRYEFPRVSHCFMEPHVSVVVPLPDGGVEVWASEQGGRLVKNSMSAAFALKPTDFHIHVPFMGGGFGGKDDCPVTGPAIMLARKCGRPVKIVQTREEVFSSGQPRPSATIYVTDAYNKDGTLAARRVKAFVNCGAYTTSALVMLDHSVYGVSGNYRNPCLLVDAYGIYTNTQFNGPYRALGCELFVYAIERNLDTAAEMLGISKHEIRRRNVLHLGDVDGHGQVVTSNGSAEALEAAAEYIRFDEPARPAEGPWRYGKGIALGNKFTAYGHTGTEANVIIWHDDTIEVHVSHVEMGQGSMTVDCQHVAEFFKVPMSRIRIRNENSDFMPYDEGTYCSRGTYINGNAIILACKDAKRQILERASVRMGVDKDKLDTEGFRVFEIANPEHFIYFHDLYEGGGWAPEGKLVGRGVFMPEQALNNPRNAQGNPVLFYSIGGWGMEVGVNIETGEVKLMQAGGFYDAGRVLNRKTCEGQIEGALSMGLGQAVFEEIMTNDQGRVINGNFRDYKVPTFMDNPNNEHVHVDFVGDPFETGPNGAKGVGEVALIPVMAAVANAINAATGAEIHNIPMTRERVLQALRDKEAAEKKGAVS